LVKVLSDGFVEQEVGLCHHVPIFASFSVRTHGSPRLQVLTSLLLSIWPAVVLHQATSSAPCGSLRPLCPEGARHNVASHKSTECRRDILRMRPLASTRTVRYCPTA